MEMLDYRAREGEGNHPVLEIRNKMGGKISNPTSTNNRDIDKISLNIHFFH